MSEPHPTIRPRKGVLDIAAYVPGESKAEGSNRVTKLSANENPHGPSKRALEAYHAAAETLALYPLSDHTELREAIAEVHGIDASRIICGVGSDEVIRWLCYAYAGPGDEVIHTEHGFGMYSIAARGAGATPVEAPETERRIDIDAILAAAGDATKLVFIANPNNPTGTLLTPEDLTRLAEGLPSHTLLVLDGAYAEFVTAPGYDAGLSLVESRDNTVMTRTFSKAYGLGGLRIGWGYGPAHVIDALQRVRDPFNLSQAALDTATAAVRDQNHIGFCRAENARLRTWLAAELAKLGLPSDPSEANFILIRFPTTVQAEACDAALRAHGVIVRRVGSYKLPHCLRISIGDEVACRLVATLIADHLKDRA